MRSLREIIRQIAVLDGLGPDLEEALYQQARVLYQKGVVHPVETASRGQTARYDADTAAMLRVMLILGDVGVSIADSRSFFTKPNLAGGAFATEFGSALDGIRQGEDWELRIEFRRHWETGERQLTGGFRRVGEGPNALARQILDDRAALHATAIVPVSALVAPLLAVEG